MMGLRSLEHEQHNLDLIVHCLLYCLLFHMLILLLSTRIEWKLLESRDLALNDDEDDDKDNFGGNCN